MDSIVFHVLNFTYSREEDTTEKSLTGLQITQILFLQLGS